MIALQSVKNRKSFLSIKKGIVSANVSVMYCVVTFVTMYVI